MEVCLQKMTKELAKCYYRNFETDPDIFLDMALYKHYAYSDFGADAYYERQISQGREYFAIMVDGSPIGEIILKGIDLTQKCCTLSIHLQRDFFKNKGYGTQAEILALEYAFRQLGMETVYADAVIKNERSRHVLQKVGFMETHRDEQFCYFRCDQSGWKAPKV